MSKFNSFYNRLQTIFDQLDDFVGVLEEKQNSIEDHALELDRDMTDREQERYDLIDEQIFSVRECMDNIESALYCLEEHCAE